MRFERPAFSKTFFVYNIGLDANLRCDSVSFFWDFNHMNFFLNLMNFLLREPVRTTLPKSSISEFARSLISTRREKSKAKYERAHEFYARTTHRANAAGVSCYVCYMTSCVRCTIRSLVLKAPTHLRKSLASCTVQVPRC